ncbi:MAG TPA: hypothetical protein VKX49_12385 [Bryobacteraceae bacterium]|nr:hypothetical protein [Bryobacteraceae bacterium]
MGYLKLLNRINEKVPYGFSFEGTLLRPGKTVSFEELRPTNEYPEVPIILECAGTQNPQDGRPSTRHWPTLYILWQLDPRKLEWKEIARAQSESWDWAADLRPIAKRLLQEARGGIEVFRGADQVARRISDLLEKELLTLAPPDRGRALGILHDQFCSQFARL